MPHQERKTCYVAHCNRVRTKSYLCEQHDKKCSFKPCYRQAQKGLGDSERCLEHKPCKYSLSCQAFASTASDDHAQWVPYCEKHKCRERFCTRERAQQPGRPEGEAYPLCSEHLEKFLCAAECDPPCDRPARRYGQDRYCATHSLCHARLCQNDRMAEYPLCAEHKCNRIRCPNEVNNILKFCELHRCTGKIEKHGKEEDCRLPTVTGPDGKYLEFCAQHCCQYNVRDDRLCPEYNENQSYCKDHRCIIEDCNRARLVDIEADASEHCLKHFKMNVKRDSGVGVRPAMPGGF